MFNRLVSKVKNQAENVNIKDKSSAIWDKYYPKFEDTVVNGFLDIAEDKLSSEEDILLVIHKTYELLPTLVRLALSRDFFTEKVIAQKHNILAKVVLKKEQRLVGVVDQAIEFKGE